MNWAYVEIFLCGAAAGYLGTAISWNRIVKKRREKALKELDDAMGKISVDILPENVVEIRPGVWRYSNTRTHR